MNRHDRREWLSAKTITDLGERTARWLTGDLRETPGYRGNGPDPETASLIPTLARLNTVGGIVTIESQPGGTGSGVWQRPCVELLADPEVGAALARDARSAGFMVAAYAPPYRRWRDEVADAIDVTFLWRRGRWQPYPDGGIKRSRHSLLGMHFDRACSAEACAAVLDAHQIAIADFAGHEFEPPEPDSPRLWEWLDRWAYAREQAAGLCPGC